MKIVVLGMGPEIGLLKVDTLKNVQIVPVETRKGMIAEKDADVFFDFSESDAVDWQFYETLAPKLVVVHAVNEVLGNNPARAHLVRINAWPGFMQNNRVELSGAEKVRDQAGKVFEKLGVAFEWVPDKIGMVSPRVVSMIVNEAYFALGEKISTKEEIDTAMKLGMNYPYGPFEWSKKIGLKQIYSLLTKLQGMDDRYVVAAALEAELKENT